MMGSGRILKYHSSGHPIHIFYSLQSECDIQIWQILDLDLWISRNSEHPNMAGFYIFQIEENYSEHLEMKEILFI